MTLKELESYLWGAATYLRGFIDAGDYKQYIFPLLFYKRICDVYDEEYEDALAESDGDLEYAAFDEKPSIQVSVSSFYLAEAPVTQALWTEIMGDNPSHFKGDDLPVERVSWEDCQEFIKRLNIQTGIKFRLPTEAEWEYAARGGQCSKHYKYAGANDDAKSGCMWFKENSQSQSHAVKTKSANELDLYDMSGNISEWCSDWYFNSYANNGERVNPKGPTSGVAKVYRGGSWDDNSMNCRVSKRYSMNPIFKNKLVGMRLAATNI